MIRFALTTWLFASLLPQIGYAQAVIANRAIPGKTVITASDVSLIESAVPGAYSRIEDTIGLETRVTIYAGKPVREGQLGTPAVVERNSVVTLRFNRGGLVIEAEGKALGRGSVGDVLRVMNLSSRTTVTGTVAGPGLIEVR